MNQQREHGVVSGSQKVIERQFECEVDGIGVTGTVWHIPLAYEEFKVKFLVNRAQEFSFEIARLASGKFAVPAVRRFLAPGVQHLRYTSGTLIGRAVCRALPVEQAFELGVKKCVEWYRETDTPSR